MKEDLIIFKENNLYGAKSASGEIIIAPQYIEMYPFCCGLSMVRNKDYQYAYINRDNLPVIPFGKYTWLDPEFVCGYARIIQYNKEEGKEKWGIINTLGHVIVPIEYDNIWTINEKYIFSIKAYLNNEEVSINLNKYSDAIILDGLNYIREYSIPEFKNLFDCKSIYVRLLKKTNQLFITYGRHIGAVGGNGIPKDPVIAIVSNSNGKIFALLIDKSDVGKTTLQIATKSQEETKTVKPVYSHNRSEKSDYWEDQYDDERYFYDGWSREDVESGLCDAYEGDLSNLWNTD